MRNEQKQLIIFNTSSMLKWKLVTSVPYYELTEGINYIGRTIVLTIAFTLLAAYILGVGFALSLVRPVRELQRYMKRVEVGDFSGKVSVDSRDEIGMLAQGFNKMVRRLSALLDEIYYSKLKETQMILRQKETELKVLQSQLNPHFLYNSLETIRGMALESGKDEIATMALSLAKLLRYHLRNTASTVTLRQEISFCEIYLRIQKYRFEEKLDYELVIPDWAEEQNIAKFSLQPIIENCMVHGLEPHMEKMTVKVEVIRETETTFFVQISDTGPGMAEETLARLRRDLKMKDITDGGSHIGIVNVHRRNTYIFGEAFGVHIDSVVGKGTVIRIRLPMNGEDCSEERGECNDAHRFTGR